MTLKRASLFALSLILVSPVLKAEDESAVASYKKLVSAASRYEKGSEDKGTFKERIEGQRQAWEDYKKARDEYQNAIARAKKEREAAEAQVEKDQKEILSLESQANNDTDAYTRYLKEQQGKGKDVTGRGILGLGIGTTAEQDRAEALRTQMRKAEVKLSETRARIKAGEEKAKAQKKVQEDNQSRFEDAVKKIQAYAKGYNVMKEKQEKARDAAAEQAADELFNDMKDYAYDAELLLTHYETLTAKHQINELHLKALQARADQHLQNTIFGKFVQSRLDQALKKENICKAVNQCEPPAVYDAKKVSDLERRVNDLAAKAQEEDKASEEEAKKEESTPVTTEEGASTEKQQ